MDPLENNEYIKIDIFDDQINHLRKKLFDDKEIFDIIEEKVNEIKYIITGNHKYSNKGENIDNHYSSRTKYKPSSRRRFSLFKTPIVIANIPKIISSKSTNSSVNKFRNNFLINGTTKEKENSVKENKSNNSTLSKSELITKNNNSKAITDISRSNVLLNNPLNVEKNIKLSNIKKYSSENALELISNPNQKSSKLSENENNKITKHESLSSLHKNIILYDNFVKTKNDLKDDDILNNNGEPISKKNMILTTFINNDIKNIIKLNENEVISKPFDRNDSENMYLIFSKGIISSITSFKERLINKDLKNLEEKKEFINQIRKEVNIYI